MYWRHEDKLTNLLKEIETHCKLEDIDYVLSRRGYEGAYYSLDKDWFLEQAERITYDSSYGGEVINLGLVIVLKDGSWLERGEYDGSEWFEKKCKPQKVEQTSNDLGILFATGHRCPFNEAIIDNTSICNRTSPPKDGKYALWLDKGNEVNVEEYDYVNGNYQDQHMELMT